MPRLAAVLIALSLLAGPRPAQAEPVYDFVVNCRAQTLGFCFHLISERLNKLNSTPDRRVCLPRYFGATMAATGVIPVSVLEHVRIRLAAAQFGSAGTDVDDIMARIVGALYPCNREAARR